MICSFRQCWCNWSGSVILLLLNNIMSYSVSSPSSRTTQTRSHRGRPLWWWWPSTLAPRPVVMLTPSRRSQSAFTPWGKPALQCRHTPGTECVSVGVDKINHYHIQPPSGKRQHKLPGFIIFMDPDAKYQDDKVSFCLQWLMSHRISVWLRAPLSTEQFPCNRTWH